MCQFRVYILYSNYYFHENIRLNIQLNILKRLDFLNCAYLHLFLISASFCLTNFWRMEMYSFVKAVWQMLLTDMSMHWGGYHAWGQMQPLQQQQPPRTFLPKWRRISCWIYRGPSGNLDNIKRPRIVLDKFWPRGLNAMKHGGQELKLGMSL